MSSEKIQLNLVSRVVLVIFGYLLVEKFIIPIFSSFLFSVLPLSYPWANIIWDAFALLLTLGVAKQVINLYKKDVLYIVTSVVGLTIIFTIIVVRLALTAEFAKNVLQTLGLAGVFWNLDIFRWIISFIVMYIISNWVLSENK